MRRIQPHFGTLVGSSTVFRHLVPHLSRTHTVTTYSRRGLSHSTLHGPQDYAARLSTDADDLAALITAVAPPARATVFGTSSGALVALRFLSRHPAHAGVAKVVAHEPPAVAVLPDGVREERGVQHRALYDLYRAAGAPHAVETFAAVFAADVDGGEREKAGLLEVLDPSKSADARADVGYWLEREMGYVFEEVDVGALERVDEGRLVLAVGERTGEGRAGEATWALAGRLGWGEGRVRVLPGGHVGYVTEPEAFAEALARV